TPQSAPPPLFPLTPPTPPPPYPLSLHDALPISGASQHAGRERDGHRVVAGRPPEVLHHLAIRSASELDDRRHVAGIGAHQHDVRSEEHTSELQSRFDLVCRLLLEKKKKKGITMRLWTYSRLLPKRRPRQPAI